ncbi:hypothetical protein I4U23_027411 [Adineta vaga]|nr:hypothetical protein I4U23_027411 [Adineta vaga]
MHIIFRISLILIIFISVIYCQGTTGPKGRSRPGRNHFYRGRHAGYMRSGYQIPTTFIEYVITFGIFIVFLMALYHLWSNSFPTPSNEEYVNIGSNREKCDQFHSGFWLSRYYQYDKFHGPYRFSLLFDPETSKITGNGSDDIGEFVIEGVYSIKTNRIAFIKKYRKGTGNLIENLGHNVTIQVDWNCNQYQFEGKWFIKTKNYNEEGRVELKFERSYRSME